MNISVILAHPKPGSFNHAIADVVLETINESGHQVFFHDLYAEKFNPVLVDDHAEIEEDILSYGSELTRSDLIIFIHPNWWGQPPAILKGWIDRVFRQDVAYRYEQDESGRRIKVGALHARAALVINTANVPPQRDQQMGNTLEHIWKDCILEPSGVEHIHRLSFNLVAASSLQQRQEWLNDVRTSVLECIRLI